MPERVGHGGVGERHPVSDRSPGERDPPVVVYRVVDETELSYLKYHGDYGWNPSQSGKYFALTIDGARAFAEAPMNAGTTITTTTRSLVRDAISPYRMQPILPNLEHDLCRLARVFQAEDAVWSYPERRYER